MRFRVAYNRFPGMAADLENRVRAVNFAAATNIVERAASSMEGPKSGRMYRVPGTKSAVHQASAPGEAPAILFGQLRASMGVRELGGTAFMAYTDDPKAPYLEFGTATIAPRPFMLPATELERPEWEAALKNAIGEL